MRCSKSLSFTQPPPARPCKGQSLSAFAANQRVSFGRESGSGRAAGKSSVELDHVRARDVPLDGDLRLVTFKHDPWEGLQHSKRSAWSDAERGQPFGATGELARDPRHAAARSWCHVCEWNCCWHGLKR